MRSEHSSNARARLFRKRISWLSLLAGALLVGILVHACLAGRWQFVLPTLILLSLVIGSIVVLRQA